MEKARLQSEYIAKAEYGLAEFRDKKKLDSLLILDVMQLQHC